MNLQASIVGGGYHGALGVILMFLDSRVSS